jgi:hypothetical protein
MFTLLYLVINSKIRLRVSIATGRYPGHMRYVLGSLVAFRTEGTEATNINSLYSFVLRAGAAIVAIDAPPPRSDAVAIVKVEVHQTM